MQLNNDLSDNFDNRMTLMGACSRVGAYLQKHSLETGLIQREAYSSVGLNRGLAVYLHLPHISILPIQPKLRNMKVYQINAHLEDLKLQKIDNSQIFYCCIAKIL